MPTRIHYSPVAASYAEALLQLATDDKNAEPVGQELSAVHEIIKSNPSFGLFLTDPAITHERRGQVIERVFHGNLSKLLQNFLGVLNEKGRINLLTQIVAAYHDLLNRQANRIEVTVTVAEKLGDEHLEQVRKRIGEAMKKDVTIHEQVNESILGGLMLNIQDRLIDASVKSQLQLMRQQLMRPANSAASPVN